MKGLAAVLGMVAIPVTAFSYYIGQTWTIIIRDVDELPKTLLVNVGGKKYGKGWTVDLGKGKAWIPNAETGFKGTDIRIEIEPGRERDDATSVVIEYKYKGMKCWKKIFIAVENFYEKNNYTFGVRLLDKNSPCDTVYWMHWMPDGTSWGYKLVALTDGRGNVIARTNKLITKVAPA